jgi:signal transduction histidine kinase
MALIEVEDNGPGMDEETRKRAFEPFFTTKEVGHGTGLGLSVSYFIITENHGGTMLLNSSPGSGTRFSIRIPFEHRQTMWGLRL